MNEKINKILKDSIESLQKPNIGDKATAGRTIQAPASTLKPTIIIKPKEK